VNEGWRWTTTILVALGLGCLLVVLMFLVVLAATFASIAYTLARNR
jgi:hypothetical protein